MRKRTRTRIRTKEEVGLFETKTSPTPVPKEQLDQKYGSILALDPSLTAFGWAVIRPNGTVADAGVIQTKPADKKLKIRKGDDFVKRVNTLCVQLHGIIKWHNCKLIVSEQPHGSQSAVAAKALGAVLGLVQTTAHFSGCGLEWYMEGECKLNLLDRRSANKGDVIKKIEKKYPETPWKKTKVANEAIADSITVWHLAKRESPTIPILAQNFNFYEHNPYDG